MTKIFARIASSFIVFIFVISIFGSISTLASSYKQGSKGDVVKQIQTKLKNWGYYSGSVDGVFGSGTTNAVKKFQKKNNLTADGVVGNATLKALGIQSKSTSGGSSSKGTSGGTSTSDADTHYLLSRIISAEARGEPYVGQVAVGAVVLNRVNHPSFPNTVAGVIYQPGAFTAIVDGQYDQPIAEISKKAARDAMNGQDTTGGAIYYYNPARTTNKWIYSREVITTIGKHVFAK